MKKIEKINVKADIMTVKSRGSTAVGCRPATSETLFSLKEYVSQVLR